MATADQRWHCTMNWASTLLAPANSDLLHREARMPSLTLWGWEVRESIEMRLLGGPAHGQGHFELEHKG
jgi:hypothetical protein